MSQSRLTTGFCNLNDCLYVLLFLCQHDDTVGVVLVGEPDDYFDNESVSLVKLFLLLTSRYTDTPPKQQEFRGILMLQRDDVSEFTSLVSNS